MVRKDMADLVYLTAPEKYAAIIKDIEGCRERGQPVLVGTVSIEQSELLNSLLKKANIPHSVLNAKFHEKEAEIVAQAGSLGAVTIATNMAGRGTDIVLGGNWNMEIEALENPTAEQKAKIKADWKIRHDEVLAAGGLHIRSEEHTSELQSPDHLVCRLLLDKKKYNTWVPGGKIQCKTTRKLTCC